MYVQLSRQRAGIRSIRTGRILGGKAGQNKGGANLYHGTVLRVLRTERDRADAALGMDLQTRFCGGSIGERVLGTITWIAAWFGGIPFLVRGSHVLFVLHGT